MIGRDVERSWFLKKSQSGKAELIVLYGRRRVGKTYLLENTFPEALFLTADLADTVTLINRFSEPLKQRLGLPGGIALSTWDDFFSLLENALIQKRCRLVIWDEFQYIPQRDHSFLSIFQRWWDSVFSKMPVLMVLCGSMIGMMERIALSEKSPLYGRRTGQYHLQPLDFFSVRGFLQKMNPLNRVLTYSVTGGIPLYLKQFSEYVSFEKGLLEKVLSPGEFLVEEGRFLVLEEFKKDPTSYFSILQTIASGRTRASEVAQLSGIPHQNLPVYLRNLLNLHLVKKEFPFALKTPKKTPLYFIDDEYLKFYFRFLMNSKDLIYRERGSDLLKNIMDQMSVHASMTFEKICRAWLERSESFERVGRWWDKNEEIDIVGIKGNLLAAAECKWTNQPLGVAVYRNLLRKTALFQGASGKNNEKTEFYLFSRSGFRGISPAPDLHLVDLETLSSGD
ncbi:MAG: ATP-binding protein [Thermovirgaceae bacterium]|nr:ATP-binding protein [Thermovirgaceae bacterium]